VHERLVITDDRGAKTLNLWDDCDLPAMRLEIGVLDKRARADPCAVDHKVEFRIDILKFFETDVRMDLAGSIAKARREVIEINSGVHQRDGKRETTGKTVFILSGSRIRGRSRRIPRRNLKSSASGCLDIARDGRSAQRNCPIWNFNFTSAQ